MVRSFVDYIYFQVYPSVSSLSPTSTSLVAVVISARPLWLKTVRVASAPSYRARMRLCVRHGLLGEIALTMDVMERSTLGWDIMKQMARVLRLDSPFQVVLYADSSSVIQSPLRAVQLDTVMQMRQPYAISCNHCKSHQHSNIKTL